MKQAASARGWTVTSADNRIGLGMIYATRKNLVKAFFHGDEKWVRRAIKNGYRLIRIKVTEVSRG